MINAYAVKGNILDSTANIIMHQVNCIGVMGAGLAKQIRNRYPIVYDKYKEYVNSTKSEDLLGTCQLVDINTGRCLYKGDSIEVGHRYVANIFGQFSIGISQSHTDYQAVINAVDEMCGMIKDDCVISYPYLMGCGLAGGDWNIYSKCLGSNFGKHFKDSKFKVGIGEWVYN